MGVYGEHVLPRLVNRVCGDHQFDALRTRVCAGLTGEIVEIGFGSGTNVPFYPPAVTLVHAVEPADLSWHLAQRRVAASPVPVARSGLDGQRLPFPDAAFPAALCTFTLCTVPDPATALGEVHRVLQPGGRLHFLEHGRAPDEGVRRWQRRIEPVQKILAGGCHLTRSTTELITTAGFEIEELDEFYLDHGPRFGGACSLGVAVRP